MDTEMDTELEPDFTLIHCIHFLTKACCSFLVGPYAFFRPYHLNVYGPHTGTFFSWFSKEIACMAVLVKVLKHDVKLV